MSLTSIESLLTFQGFVPLFFAASSISTAITRAPNLAAAIAKTPEPVPTSNQDHQDTNDQSLQYASFFQKYW